MKTIFTLFSSLLLSASLFAADAKPKSMLTVKSSDRGSIKLMLDGKQFESTSNTITIQGLTQGYHTIKLYHQKNTGVFNFLNKKYDVVYNTSLNIKSGTMISLTVDRFGRTTVQESKIFGDKQGRGWENGYGRADDHTFDVDRDDPSANYASDYDQGQSMSDREFDDVLQAISKEWLESNKLKSVTQIVSTNNITTAQVKELMLLFDIEKNKLEVAKEAYQNTVDKKNYSTIYDELNFDSSKDDLAHYVHSSR